MSVRVACPACGGPVVFEVGSSMVAVCPYCRSAVARGDRSVEDLGKVAELVETGAVLRVGLEGHYDGRKFRLTGRTQLGHAAGGVWDEWYAAFAGDRWGWLSEAQGRFYLLFEREGRPDRPAFDQLEPGRSVPLPEADTRFVVAETGTATVKGAEGEIPYRLVPGSTYPYADLSGEGGGFATLDYGQEQPALYLGREVTLDDLGVPENLRRRETFELREVAPRRINCPNCGGPLDLRAPDKTERVGCPYCGSLLDTTRGELTLLEALKEPPFELLLPLGAKGTFGADERTVIGALERSVTVEGVDYKWQEYLLYHPRDGFEWLVRADNHWTRVKGVPAADVEEGKYLARYDRRTFRKFQAGWATVRGVIGECYWKVAVGEKAEAVDYIRPPELLSCERSRSSGAWEVNWSVGSYLTPAEVQRAFGLKESLPAPVGVAPNQPFPYTPVYRYAAYFFVALCVLGIVMLVVSPTRKVYEQTFQVRATTPATAAAPAPGPAAPPAPPETTQIFFTDRFELKPRRNVRVTVSCPDLTGWLVVEGDLVQQANGQVQPFLVPLSYETGVEDGETWTAGSRQGQEFVSAQPPGEYSLRLEVEKEKQQFAGPLTVRVEQGAANAGLWLLTLIGLLLAPAVVGVYHIVFVSRRWQNSDFSMLDTEGTAGGGDAPPVTPAGAGGRPGARSVRDKRKKKGRKGGRGDA
jgi:hypothetical protein